MMLSNNECIMAGVWEWIKAYDYPKEEGIQNSELAARPDISGRS